MLTSLTSALTAAFRDARAAEREWDAAVDAMVEGRFSGTDAERDERIRRVQRAQADAECARAVLERCEREVGRVWRVAMDEGKAGA